MKTSAPEIEVKAPGTTFKEVPGKIDAGVPFPIPPLTKQHRIAARVDELMALCDQLEAQLTATHTDSRRLFEAVLHEALSPAREAVA
jgi:type I restriction enzyme S subunit